MPLLEKDRPRKQQAAGGKRPAKQPCAGCVPKAPKATLTIDDTPAGPCQPCVVNLLRAAEQMLDFAAHRRRAAEFLNRAAHEARDRPELQAGIYDALITLADSAALPNLAHLKSLAQSEHSARLA